MERKDIKALGLVMMELMEPDTNMLFPETITLKHPERWSEQTGIKAFLAATETASLVDLSSVNLYFLILSYIPQLTRQQNIFLPTKSVPQCLKPHILMAQISARASWEIFI